MIPNMKTEIKLRHLVFTRGNMDQYYLFACEDKRYDKESEKGNEKSAPLTLKNGTKRKHLMSKEEAFIMAEKLQISFIDQCKNVNTATIVLNYR